MVAGLADGDVGVGAEQHRVRAVDAAVAQLAERLGDRRRVLAHVRGQAHRRIAGARPDALDAGRGIAVEDRAVLGEGDLRGGVLDRLPVGVLRPALHVVDLLAVQGERGAQFHQRRGQALPGEHPVGRRVDVAHPAGAHRGQPVARRALHVHHPPPGEVALERAGGLLLDLRPRPPRRPVRARGAGYPSPGAPFRLPILREPGDPARAGAVVSRAGVAGAAAPRFSSSGTAGTKNRFPVTAVLKSSNRS